MMRQKMEQAITRVALAFILLIYTELPRTLYSERGLNIRYTNKSLQ